MGNRVCERIKHMHAYIYIKKRNKGMCVRLDEIGMCQNQEQNKRGGTCPG